MKRLFTIIATVILTASLFSQSPQKMSYQAVIRDGGGTLVQSHAVGMRIQILQTSEFGTAVYIETHTPTTNINGLVTLEIGTGNVVKGTFTGIDWANGPYFIKTETDPTGGSTYTITGISQLLSVPYALHAKTAESITGGTTLAIGDSYQGGIIFYLDASGQHGLVAATADQSSGIQWYNDTYTTTNAVRDGIGAGMYNTERIIANQGAYFYPATGEYAAQSCANYQSGGYGDWYLPSKYELNLLYLQKTVVGATNVFYWSSTEAIDFLYAWCQVFSDGSQNNYDKNLPMYVRAIRAF